MPLSDEQQKAIEQIGREVREASDRILAAWQRFTDELSRRLADR